MSFIPLNSPLRRFIRGVRVRKPLRKNRWLLQLSCGHSCKIFALDAAFVPTEMYCVECSVAHAKTRNGCADDCTEGAA